MVSRRALLRINYPAVQLIPRGGDGEGGRDLLGDPGKKLQVFEPGALLDQNEVARVVVSLGAGYDPWAGRGGGSEKARERASTSQHDKERPNQPRCGASVRLLFPFFGGIYIYIYIFFWGGSRKREMKGKQTLLRLFGHAGQQRHIDRLEVRGDLDGGGGVGRDVADGGGVRPAPEHFDRPAVLVPRGPHPPVPGLRGKATPVRGCEGAESALSH